MSCRPAIGAKMACPNDPVVVVVGRRRIPVHGGRTGHGRTAQIPIIIVVVNNGYLGLIRQNQKYAYGYEYGVRLGIATAKRSFPTTSS